MVRLDEAITGRCRNRPLEHELNEFRLARRNRRIAQHDDAPGHFDGSMMHLDRKPLTDGPGFRAEHAQPRIDTNRRRVQHRIEHHVAAPDGLLADLRPAQNQRAPLPGISTHDRLVLGVDGAHARLQAGRADHNAVVHLNAARQHGAAHGRAKPRKRE
jgi:hypothetical protein